MIFAWLIRHKSEIRKFKKESRDRAGLGVFHYKNMVLRTILQQELIKKGHTRDEAEEIVSKGIDHENQFEKWRSLCEELIGVDEKGVFYLKLDSK